MIDIIFRFPLKRQPQSSRKWKGYTLVNEWRRSNVNAINACYTKERKRLCFVSFLRSYMKEGLEIYANRNPKWRKPQKKGEDGIKLSAKSARSVSRIESPVVPDIFIFLFFLKSRLAGLRLSEKSLHPLCVCVCVSLRATSQPIKEMRFVHAILVFGLLSTCFQMAPCDDSQDERYSTNETVTAIRKR